MNDKMKSLLESIAHDIPEDTNLWPDVSARVGRNTLALNPRTRLIWTVLLVLLALAAFTTVAYALYYYFIDPGLQHVSEAGMVTDLDVTAQPTSVVGTPVWGVPKPALQIGETQAQDTVSVTLNWIYVEDSHQAIGFTVTGLEGGLHLGLPTVKYAGVTPEGFSGATMRLDEAGNGILVTYQILREGMQDSKVDVSIDIPVERGEETVSTFHFDVKDAPADMIGGGGGNSYAVRVNGVELRQEYVIVAPDYTEARLCYPKRSVDDWQLQDVSVQFMSENSEALQIPAGMQRASLVSDGQDERCVIVTFPLGVTSEQAGEQIASVVTVGSIGTAAEKIDGPWQFNTILVDLVHAEGASLSTPTPKPPLAEETIGDLKAVLDWAYADANRMAFELHFDGWEAGYFVNGLSLRTADGQEVNSSLGYEASPDDPSRFTFDFEPVSDQGVDHFNGDLVVMVSNDPVNFASLAEYHFKLDLPVYPAFTLDPMQEVSANGIDMLLQRLKITPSFTYVYLCFNKPSTGDFGDWQVAYANDGMGPRLRVGDDQATLSTARLIFDSDLGDIGKGPEAGWTPPIETGRCMKVGFPVGHHDIPERLTLTVPALENSVPEVIPDAEIERAQELLRAQGIEMTYTTFTGNGGGGGGPLFTEKPEGMTDTQAYQKFIEALGYIREGPWVFEVEVSP